MPVKGIRVSGRNTQGVRLVNLDEGDLVMDVARVVSEDDRVGAADGEEPTGEAPEEEDEEE
jgi:DNA gyrase subunit A